MRKTDEWYELAAGEIPKLLVDKLAPFGFRCDGDAYFYDEDLLAGSFRLHIRVSEDGIVSTLLWTRSQRSLMCCIWWKMPRELL